MTFEKLTKDVKDFSRKLFVLKPGTWYILPLTEEIEAKTEKLKGEELF